MTSALSAGDLLAGSGLVHDVKVPEPLVAGGGVVRIRPLTLAVLAAISKAARDDAGLVPVLMIKEALVEPSLSFDQIRQLRVGLVQFLLDEINAISGLDGGADADAAARSTLGASHLLLAKHFGWTPAQVGALTPGQVAVYLAGVRQLVEYDRATS